MWIYYYFKTQRKFAREVPDARRDTYKQYRDWVDQHFGEGINNEVWEEILTEDSQHCYLPSVAVDYEVSREDVIEQPQYQ